ncbi:beta-lactamase family protein [Pyxidicoccus parkwayensis]|uniref:Beta-lactamase family protein n=1 Tax=Pyxidicoccus parkwayensis TaxID=2813578 RepID=A0ABX7P7R0_9BACT|nr:serine hydrolase domain-containing protein [Pyxidicoccus parkwaysis]QSQ26445.1 beta-lactamase family protein [Pyxidicoccus parkwaysis]
MADFGINVDPGEVGFDAQRLQRIDTHFRRYVDDGRLAGWQVMVSRRGKVAHLASYGHADREAGRAVEADTVWRIYSMTKPVTSVAAMMLWEEGTFELSDPVSKWLPEFSQPRVYMGGPATRPVTVPATEPIRVWHLLTHTAGLTYGFHRIHVTDEIHRLRGFDLGAPEGFDLAACVRGWAELPLTFQPGAEWNYSVATDVLGRLVEVLSGKSLEAFFRERIFGPLGMKDTGFWCPEDQQGRLAALYMPVPATGKAIRADAFGRLGTKPPAWLSGGGGLVSTTRDFSRFTWMLQNGGELEGVRLLSPRTVKYMTRNHLPGGVDLATYGRPLFAETRYDGVGFGLGFGVVIDPVAYRVPTSAGEYHWGGMASTAFWVDPAEELAVVFMTQLLPSSTWPLRSQLRQLVYQALVD